MARGWAVMAAATLVWSLGQVIYTYYGLARDHVYPFPSAADAGYLAYAVWCWRLSTFSRDRRLRWFRECALSWMRW